MCARAHTHVDSFVWQAGNRQQVKESEAPAFLLHRVRLIGIPHFDRDGGCNPFFTVFVKEEKDHENLEVYRSQDHYGKPTHLKPEEKTWQQDLPEGQRVAGDVQIVFYDAGYLFQEKMCSMWMHTWFIKKPPPDMGGMSRQLGNEVCVYVCVCARVSG